MKPDWKDAPEWANYLAMDYIGTWWWYENQPVRNEDDGMWWDSGDKGMCRRVQPVVDWKCTLEERPKTRAKKTPWHVLHLLLTTFLLVYGLVVPTVEIIKLALSLLRSDTWSDPGGLHSLYILLGSRYRLSESLANGKMKDNLVNLFDPVIILV